MGRFLKYFLIILAILFIALVIVWNYFPKYVAKTLSKETGVTVKIGDMDITPWSIGVERLKIGNPPRYNRLPQALAVDNMDVKVPITRFFHEEIVIPQMTLDDIYLGIEIESRRDSSGNWSTIINNLQKGKSTKEGSDTAILIQSLLLTDLRIELVIRQDGRQIRKLTPIKRLELKNVGSEGGFPTQVITDIIMRELMKEIFIREGLQNLIKGVLNPRQGIQNIFKGLFLNHLENEPPKIGLKSQLQYNQ